MLPKKTPLANETEVMSTQSLNPTPHLAEATFTKPQTKLTLIKHTQQVQMKKDLTIPKCSDPTIQ